MRNRLVNSALEAAVKANPAPLYRKEDVRRITTGNFDDNLKDLAGCDWTIEVVVERLDIKKTLYERVEQFRKPGTLITSNTSGIPIHLLAEGRSEDFKQHFCGTHFFNPPRYLKLLEIIPTSDTKPEVVDFLLHYGDLYLGKTVVLAQDTPGFIANRVGVFGLLDAMHVMQELGLTVEEVDKLTGPVIGHAKSATFRTSDVVGLDTTINVANGLGAEPAPRRGQGGVCPARLRAEDEREQVAGRQNRPGLLPENQRRGWQNRNPGARPEHDGVPAEPQNQVCDPGKHQAD